MKGEDLETPHRELYALLHISPEASDEEIRRAYRQWAQIYHPDKYQSPQAVLLASETLFCLSISVNLLYAMKPNRLV